MIALRVLMLLPCSAALGVALVGANEPMAPSATRLVVSASVLFCALWLWPGTPASARASLVRVGTWTAGAVAVAALQLFLLGPPARPLAIAALACGMLALVLWPALSLIAAVQSRSDASRRETGIVWAVTMALVALAAAPLWAGPLSEAVAVRYPDAPAALASISPLVHLAAASGNDLFRNEWLYVNANLASLPVDPPAAASAAAGYAVLGAITTAALLRASRHASNPPADDSPSPAKEPFR